MVNSLIEISKKKKNAVKYEQQMSVKIKQCLWDLGEHIRKITTAR